MDHIIEEFKTNESLQEMANWSNEQPEMKLFLRLCSSIGIGNEILTHDEIAYIHSITNRLSRLLDVRWKKRSISQVQAHVLQDE